MLIEPAAGKKWARGARTVDGRQEETQLSIGGSSRVEGDFEGSWSQIDAEFLRLMRRLLSFWPAKRAS